MYEPNVTTKVHFCGLENRFKEFLKCQKTVSTGSLKSGLNIFLFAVNRRTQSREVYIYSLLSVSAFHCTTPYVIGALKYAKSEGGFDVSITNNKDKPVKEASDICIEMLSGPEVVQGSTRMKSGTAQKMVLNIISTSVAIKLGYTYKNTMMKMQSWYNEKLKLRAKNMIVQEFNVSEEEAQKVLEKYSYKIDAAFRHFSEKSQK